jgi:uncharacterized protein
VGDAICTTAVVIPADSGRKLVKLARRTLEGVIQGEKEDVQNPWDPILYGSDYGAFVTLWKNGALRGCVGTLWPDDPLFETVAAMTRAAAQCDPRFSPVTSAELAEIRISVSLLSPLTPVDDPTMLRVGDHGLYVENGHKRGVLLPQVAVEQGWDMQEFLRQTCRKGHLAEDAWQKPDTKVACFTTHVIEEEP